jgi:PKD repeat protein
MRRSVLIVAAAFTLALVAPAGAIVTHVNGKFIGVQPIAGVAPSSLPGIAGKAYSNSGGPRPLASNGNLDYQGGPVVHHSTTYTIFWDPPGAAPREHFTTATKALINQYFADVAHDSGQNTNVYAVGQQFTDATGRAANDSTFGGTFDDTTAYPTTGNCSSPHIAPCLTRAQLETEIVSFVGAHALPTGLDPIYFILTPHDVTTCYFASSSCSDDTYCAFHSSIVSGPDTILYSHDPFTLMDSTNAKKCQHDGSSTIQEPNGDLQGDVALKAVSHEHNETITDPLGDGWWNLNNGNENGDQCNSTTNNSKAFTPTLGGTAGSGTLYNQLINGHQYYIQSEWSNGDIDCTMKPTPGVLTPAFTAPVRPAGTAIPFDPSPTTSAHTITSYQWDFGDGTTAFGPSPSHAYATTGSYPVKLTVTDDRGQTTSVTQNAIADKAPAAAFTATPGTATQGSAIAFDGSSSSDADGTVASYAWTFGDGATATGAKPARAYGSAGTFTVTLTVTDNLGVTNAVSQSVTVTAPPVVPPTPPTMVINPAVSASLVSNSLAKIAKNGLLAGFNVNEPGAAKFDLIAPAGIVKSLHLTGPTATLTAKKKVKPVLLATTTLVIPQAGAGQAKLKLSKAKIKKLRRRRSVSLVLRMTFTDAAGQRAVTSKSVKLVR